MAFTRKPLAAAVALALFTLAAPAVSFAQTAAATTEDAKKAAEAKRKADEEKQKIDTVTVTGIRGSLQKSIDVKRDADTNVEVVTAEDVGKMPDKNIADALSRLSGVNVQFGGALAMDEAERVSIRGTSPNLNLTTINGHALSSGDWHVGDQAGSGRSVGFGLMPSQLIGQAIVYKTGRADITEGGVAGTVDIITRKPLDFKNQLTRELSVGFVHADLPKKTDPQISALFSWKSDDSTYGFLLQAYKEQRHLRRDGQETFGYNFISAAAANAAGNPSLAGLRLPGSLNSALFEGERNREGGYIGFQVKPNADWDINASIFRTTLRADNYNSSGYGLPNALISNGWIIKNPVVRNDVLVSASLERPPTAAATQRVIGFQFDHFMREAANSLSSFYDVDAKWRASDSLTIKGRAGFTEGFGKTGAQPSIVFGIINPNISYTINENRPTDYKITNSTTGAAIDLANVNNYVQMSNFGGGVSSTDKEKYLHLDGEYALNKGIFTNVKFGIRTAEHRREYEVTNARWNAQDTPAGPPAVPSPFISVTGGLLVSNIVGNNVPVPPTTYPSNWFSGGSGDFPRSLFRYNTGILSDFAKQYVNYDKVLNKSWNSGYTIIETNQAGYLMTEFELPSLSGNIGVRPVKTKVQSTAYQALPNGTAAGQCVPLQPCNVPGAITSSRVATYVPQTVETSHSIALPSLNLKWDIAPKVIGRFSLSKTLGRPNYNELAGAVSLNNTLLTGSSGNPYLKPTTSTNADASLAYYFTKRGYVSGSLFSQNLKDYVKPGVSKVEFFNSATGTNSIYDVTSRVAANAKLKGAELAGELPIGAGFGLSSNYTYVNGRDSDGFEFLGTSKHTFNISGYYEDDKFSTRLSWNQRSDYAWGLIPNPAGTGILGTNRYKGYGGLAASVSYKITPSISVVLDGNNLTNPVRSTYYINESAPGYWHESGRQYFLTVRGKF